MILRGWYFEASVSTEWSELIFCFQTSGCLTDLILPEQNRLPGMEVTECPPPDVQLLPWMEVTECPPPDMKLGLATLTKALSLHGSA